MKKSPWAPILLVALPVAGAAALWAITARERTVLNRDEPTPEVTSADPAAELQRLALELKSDAYDAELGRVNYAAALPSAVFQRLTQTAAALRRFDPASLGSREAKLAFWINLYNALTVRALLAFRPKRSVWEVPGFFNRAAYVVGGYRFSLNDIEHGVLRANQPHPYSWRRPFAADDPRRRFALSDEVDPRIHFALNCGARSCPPIAFYEAARINAQLDLSARSFVQGETEVAGDRVVTSAILKWYRGAVGDLREFLRCYLDAEAAWKIGRKRIVFRRYDWSLTH